MKKSISMVILILIVSLIFNIFLLQKIKKIDHENASKDGYLKYLIMLRLDRQSYIYDDYGINLNKIENNDMTVNELKMYLSGVREFTHEEMIRGAYDIVL